MTNNPTIEQAVKALEAHNSLYSAVWDLTNGDIAILDKKYVDRFEEAAALTEQALTSLRAMQQEPVSKTDEELARELVRNLMQCMGFDFAANGEYPIATFKKTDVAFSHITQAFAAIRKQARDEALIDVLVRCKGVVFSPAPYTDLMETIQALLKDSK